MSKPVVDALIALREETKSFTAYGYVREMIVTPTGYQWLRQLVEAVEPAERAFDEDIPWITIDEDGTPRLHVPYHLPGPGRAPRHYTYKITVRELDVYDNTLVAVISWPDKSDTLQHVLLWRIPREVPREPEPNKLITRPGQLPAFTLDDVRDAFLSNPYMGGRPVPGTTVTLARLEFMPREQAEEELRLSLHGYPPVSDIVCLLEFHGTFDVTHIGPPGHGSMGLGYTHHTHLVLDGATGRRCVWGFKESSPTPD